MTKTIELSQGLHAIVDDNDYIELSKHKWYALYNKNVNNFYAVRKSKKSDRLNKKTLISMHRVILNTPNDLFTDHKNHDTLDNRRRNIRICTQSQNNMNRIFKKGTSTYKGVYIKKTKHKDKVYSYWITIIQLHGKCVFSGNFDNEIVCASVYNQIALELFGEYAMLNDLS